MHTITIALVEDDPAFREILSLYIDSQEGLALVGTATNGQEALELAEALHPEVFLMDLHMPRMDGIEATRRLLEAQPDTKIIAITTFDSYEYVSRALLAGVHGYLLKNSRPAEIKQAVIAAFEERAMIDRRALASLIISMNSDHQPLEELWDELSETEQAVTKLVCRGMTNQEVALELHYSVSSVKNTLTRVYNKLGVKTRTQLLVLASHHNFPVLD